MQRQIGRLNGMKHLLSLDPREVRDEASFNAAIDRICGVLQGEKVDVPEPAAAEAEPELDLEAKPAREAKGGKDRMHRGGKDRGGE